jgi:hypothetical protein
MRSQASILAAVLLLPACVGVVTDADRSDDDGSTDLAYPSNRGDIDYTFSTTGLYYGLGPVLTGNPTKLYMIFYGSHWTTNQIDILLDFGHAIGGSPMANVLTTFTDDGLDGNRGSSAFDLVDYTIIPTYTHGTVLSDADIAFIVNDAIAQNLPDDSNGIYLVYSDQGAGTVSSKSGACECGHHFASQNNHKIAQMDSGSWCRTLLVPQKLCDFPYLVGPNGDNDIDVMATTSWHEIAEAVSDPAGGGYRTRWKLGTNTSGETEIADLCGRALSQDDGTNPPVANLQLDRNYPAGIGGVANVHLGARDFLMQPIWQYADRGGCVRRLGFSRPAWNSIYPAGDVDGNGIADLIWRDSATGAVTVSTLDAANNVQFIFPRNLYENWQIYGFGRFSAGNTSDVLVRNIHTGELRVWLMNGGVVGQVVSLGAPPASPWLVKAVGDFNGDGYTDILFQNMSTNATRVWYNSAPSNGGTPLAMSWSFMFDLVGGLSSSDNSDVVGTGDFTGDGHHAAEVLWYDLDSGHYRTWSINGTVVTSTDLGLQYFQCDRVLGIADMDRDGTADIVCEMQSGTKVGWVRMSGGLPYSWTTIADLPTNEWRYSGASTFGPLRQPGLLWRNRKTGDLSRWLIGVGGTSFTAKHLANGMPQNMELVSY